MTNSDQPGFPVHGKAEQRIARDREKDRERVDQVDPLIVGRHEIRAVQDRRHVERGLQDAGDQLHDVAIARAQDCDGAGYPDQRDQRQDEPGDEKKNVPTRIARKQEENDHDDDGIVQQRNELIVDDGVDRDRKADVLVQEVVSRRRHDGGRLADDAGEERPQHQAAGDIGKDLADRQPPQDRPGETHDRHHHAHGDGGPELTELGTRIAPAKHADAHQMPKTPVEQPLHEVIKAAAGHRTRGGRGRVPSRQ